MCNYIQIEQLNVCTKYGILSDTYICFIRQFVNCIILLKIKDAGCYDTDVKFISSPIHSSGVVDAGTGEETNPLCPPPPAPKKIGTLKRTTFLNFK